MMRKALKGSLAAVAGLALGLGTASIALAQDEEEPAPVASGTVNSSETGILLNGSLTVEDEQVDHDANAHLLKLDIGEGDTRYVYCIQITKPLQTGNVYEERPWADIPVDQLPLVLGVLANGFDGSNAGAIIDAAGQGDDGEDPFEGYSQEQVAYAGTQAAIWSLTDGWTIDEPDATGGSEVVDGAVLAVKNYLIDNSEPIDEPDFTPEYGVDNSASEVDGTTAGPFTISTNFGPVGFEQPEGATIVDAEGNPLEEFANGETTIYVVFDEAVSQTVSLTTETVTWTTPVGRVFVPTSQPAAEFVPQSVTDSEDIEGQRVILAEEFGIPAEAKFQFELTVTPGETPSESESAAPKLPRTGASLTMVAGVGGAVLVAGVIAMVLMRRRAATSGAAWGDDEAK